MDRNDKCLAIGIAAFMAGNFVFPFMVVPGIILIGAGLVLILGAFVIKR